MAEKYFSEVRKSRLIKSQYDPNTKIDFETTLSILAKIFPLSDIREAVKKLYNKRHGPTLFYHLVAHLFKHRFIDVIINFNFDELLDEILEEELSQNGYDRILSDGDCQPKEKLVKDGRLRRPLYIKPHGTASHKSTLRFTKEHYHELPIDMRNILKDLLATEDENDKTEEVTKRINLITVGFELASIEFNEIISETLSKDSHIFNFYWFGGDDKADTQTLEDKENELLRIFRKGKLTREERNLSLPALRAKYNCPFWIPIGHEKFDVEKERFKSIKCKHLGVYYSSLDNTFLYLFEKICGVFRPEFMPRGIYRHLLISKFFGNRLFWAFLNDSESIKNQNPIPDKINLPSYFNEPEYFKDRTIVEILIAATINQGSVAPYLLMDGHVGKYYSEYFKRSKSPDTFTKILNDLDLEKEEGSDKFAVRSLKIQPEPEKIDKIISEQVVKYLKQKNLFSEKLHNYFKYIQSNEFKSSTECIESIKDSFIQLFFSDNSRIQSPVENNKYHLFDGYKITDLLTTELANNLNYFLPIYQGGVTHLCVIADFGIRVARFLNIIYQSNPKTKVYLILTENFDVDDFWKKTRKNKSAYLTRQALRNKQLEIFERNFARINEKFFSMMETDEDQKFWFSENIKVVFVPADTHNHHMTIFINSDKEELIAPEASEVLSAIYYYKWGLSSHIDPIILNEDDNKTFIVNLFKEASKNAFSLKSKANNLIAEQWNFHLNDKTANKRQS
ncbi:SIR2 family protein [Roseivirga pacifica]|uniref:SIR2 family protein n=1 Tax=Roseivirga pacifica TaxID=1267423 RepID=UPI003BAAAE14